MDEKDEAQDYNMFLSWSGERSRLAAEAFRDWIVGSQGKARPWISTEDIALGRRWSPELERRLKLKVGVFFVTPENQANPWLNFEAGSISRSIGQKGVGQEGRAIAVLIRFPEELPSTHPLSQFQYARDDEAGWRKVFLAIGDFLTEGGADAKMLDHAFASRWPHLKESLATIPAEPQTPVQTVPTNPLVEVRQALHLQGTAIMSLATQVEQLRIQLSASSLYGGQELSSLQRLFREHFPRSRIQMIGGAESDDGSRALPNRNLGEDEQRELSAAMATAARKVLGK